MACQAPLALLTLATDPELTMRRLAVSSVERSSLSRCPGVSYGISGRSLLDKFGQVPLHHFGSQIGLSLSGVTFRLNCRRLAVSERPHTAEE